MKKLVTNACGVFAEQSGFAHSGFAADPKDIALFFIAIYRWYIHHLPEFIHASHKGIMCRIVNLPSIFGGKKIRVETARHIRRKASEKGLAF